MLYKIRNNEEFIWRTTATTEIEKQLINELLCSEDDTDIGLIKLEFDEYITTFELTTPEGSYVLTIDHLRDLIYGNPKVET